MGHFFVGYFGNAVGQLHKFEGVQAFLAGVLLLFAEESFSSCLELGETLINKVLVSVDVARTPLTELVDLSVRDTLVNKLLPRSKVS